MERNIFLKKNNAQMVFVFKVPWSTWKRNKPMTASDVVKPSAVPDHGGDMRKFTLEKLLLVYVVL